MGKLVHCFMTKKIGFMKFVERSRVAHGDKYDYSLAEKDYRCSHSKVRIVCPKHGVFEQMAKCHMKGAECPKCSYEERGLRNLEKSKWSFVGKAKGIHGEKYDYSKVDYLGAKEKVCIVCPIHGEFWQTPNDHLNGRGCPLCNESHLEMSLRKFLGENKIGFEEHKHFGWLGRMELDFYIPSCNIGIECQGKQHVGLGGWKEGFDFRGLYERDKRKNELCKENGVRLFYCFSKESFKKKNEFPIYNDENSFVEIEELMVAFSKDGFSVH